MKNFEKVSSIALSVVGVSCIIGGLIFTGVSLTDHFKSEAELDKLLSEADRSSTNTMILTTPEAESEVDLADGGVLVGDALLEDGVADLDGDQEVVEITDGTQVLDIPDLDIRVPILEGTSYEVLKVAAGHFKGTGSMGKGNYCIAGHSVSSYACIFDNLHKVKMDIPVYLYDKKGKKYTYWVTDWKTVKPSDTWVVNDYGDDRCTLITCDDKGKTRLVITALKMTEEEHDAYLKEKALGKRLEVKDLSYEYSNLGIAAYLNSLGRPTNKRYGLYGDAFTGRLSNDNIIVRFNLEVLG